MRKIIRLIGIHLIHQTCPVSYACGCKTVLGRILVAVVPAPYPGADTSGNASVHYREFPVIPVVNLASPGENHGTREHGPDLDFMLVRNAAEEILEREHRIGAVFRGGGRIVVIVALLERLLLELRMRGKARQERSCKNCRYERPDLHYILASSRAWRKRRTSSSEPK